MDKQFKEELRRDQSYQLALNSIPEEQREIFEQVVLQFAEQFHTGILQKFAEHVRMATTGDS
jgi:hypothetical protein